MRWTRSGCPRRTLRARNRRRWMTVRPMALTGSRTSATIPEPAVRRCELKVDDGGFPWPDETGRRAQVKDGGHAGGARPARGRRYGRRRAGYGHALRQRRVEGRQDRPLAAQARGQGNRRGPHRRCPRRRPSALRDPAAGEDEGAHRRPAAAAGAEAVLMPTAVAGPEIERLIQLLARLPGLGPRSARRAALFLIKKRELIMAPLAQALQTAIEKIAICRTCGNIDTQNPCTVCTDLRREPSIIVVVADVADLWALERAHAISARYHVLGGTLSPLGGIGPEDLSIDALVARAHEPAVTEVILALNATVDGQTTAHYITDLLRDANVKVTRLAHGVPVGGELDYLDEGTLAAAIRQRTAF